MISEDLLARVPGFSRPAAKAFLEWRKYNGPLPSKPTLATIEGVGPEIAEQAVGFLRWEKGLVGPGKFVVEKGGRRLYIVTCDSGRYELGVFVDCEVGLIGSRRRPATESLRVLDVEKLEVLSSSNRN